MSDKMSLTLNDLISIQHSPAAVVLQTGLSDLTLADTFVPTHSSIQVLSHLERAVQLAATQEERAINCYGTYGAGKSRLGVLIGQILRDGLVSEQFDKVLGRLETVGQEKLSKRLRATFLPITDEDAKPYLVVPLYGNSGPSLQGALIEALYKEIKSSSKFSPSELLLRTEYAVAETRLDEMLELRSELKDQYLPTMGLGDDYLSLIDLKDGLNGHEEKALNVFREWHLNVTLGSPFDATQHGASHLEEIFIHAAQRLADRGYKGVAIIWDEFGYALENLLENPQRAPSEEIFALQKFVERTCSPARGHVLFLGLTHVSLAEYGPRANVADGLKNRLETIEGRFTTLKVELRPAESEGYHLLSAQIGLKEEGKAFKEDAGEQISAIVNACRSTPLFAKMEDGLTAIVRDCYPLHPFTAAALLALSARFAAATRTAFTYLVELENSGLLFTRVERSQPFTQELVRLPELASYYASSMERGSVSDAYSAFLQASAQAQGASTNQEEIRERKDVLAVVFLASVLTDPNFQASDELLALALHDRPFSSAQAEPLRAALSWLSKAGLIWKNEATDLWRMGGDGSVDIESLVSRAMDTISSAPLANLLVQHKDVFSGLLPMLGEHQFDPSPKGVVRRYTVSTQTQNFNSPPASKSDSAASVQIVIANTVEEVKSIEAAIDQFPKGRTFYWLTYSNINELRNYFRQLLALLQLLDQTHAEATMTRLVARYDAIKQKLTNELRQLYGRDGLIHGTTRIKRQGDPSYFSTAKSWFAFRDELQSIVDAEYADEVFVRAPQKGRNVLGDISQAASKETIDIVERMLNFSSTPPYQDDLLGFPETGEAAAVVDGILGANELFIKRPAGWDFKKIEELSGPVKKVIELIRTEIFLRRPKPYSLGELARKLGTVPYGIPTGALSMLIAFAIRDDTDRFVWVGGQASSAKNICNGLLSQNIGVRANEFTTYQLNIAAILEQSLRMLFERASKKLEINEGARQSRAKRSVEVLKETVGSLSQLTLGSPNIDKRLREIVENVKAVGKTMHELLEVIARIIDPDRALAPADLNKELKKAAEQTLFEILYSYNRVDDERKYAAISHLQDLFSSFSTPEERSRYVESLKFSGGIKASLGEVLDSDVPSDEALGKFFEGVLGKPLSESGELEIGVALGKVDALVEFGKQSGDEAAKLDLELKENIRNKILEITNDLNLKLDELSAYLGQIAIELKQNCGDCDGDS